MTYRTIINEIDAGVDARHVEASMRLQYGTLCHLPRETFAAEIAVFKACERVEPGYGEKLAQSFGM